MRVSLSKDSQHIRVRRYDLFERQNFKIQDGAHAKVKVGSVLLLKDQDCFLKVLLTQFQQEDLNNLLNDLKIIFEFQSFKFASYLIDHSVGRILQDGILRNQCIPYGIQQQRFILSQKSSSQA